jgi:DedD protein
MSFFKLRSKRANAEDSQSGSAQALNIDSLRRSARHRLIGATVLVLVAVVGFPIIFDTQPRPVKSDIQIEIADQDKNKSSDEPAHLKGANASKSQTESNTNESNARKTFEQKEAATGPTLGVTPKQSTGQDSVGTGSSLSQGVVGAVGGVVTGAAVHSFVSNLGSLATPSPPASANPNVANTPPSSSSSSSSSAHSATALAEPKEVIISSKAPDTKVPGAPPSAQSSNNAINNHTISASDSPPKTSPASAGTSSADSGGGREVEKNKGNDKKTTSEEKDNKPGKHLVQVGVYSDASKIKELRGRFEKLGYKVTTHTELGKNGSKRTRIRVGPFKTKEEAQRTLEKIRGMKIPESQPFVLNLP